MKLNSLLNHEPASDNELRRSSRASLSQDSYGAGTTTATTTTTTTTYEAADALTTLATLGSGQQYAHAPSRELPSPTAFSHELPRRASSYGSALVAPIEPSPPVEPQQAHSPTLEQYHHGSKSPEEQRRQSFLQRTSSPAPVLAPIQNLSSALQEQIHEEPKPMANAYGQDVSQLLPPPSRSSDDGETARDDTQSREPAFVRDEPTTTQIREPEPMDTAPLPVPAPEALPEQPSPPPAIKDEASATPRETSPSTTVTQSFERQPSITTENMDQETRKAIEALKQNDLGLRTKRTASIAESVTSPSEAKPVPPPSKKRSVPTSSSVKKKGTAALKKSSSKKRKLDTDAESNARSTPPSSRPSKSSKSGKKGSQAGTPVAESSPAPDNSSQVGADEEDGESSEDTSLYCICRKPDNHRWMIGCDGGCDDWFHGSCVDMVQSDEDLVDKFICPNCERDGRGQTTWKPMCRREGCRKPARLTRGKESKYCTDDCGVLFFQEQLQRTAGARKASSNKRPRKKGSKDGEESEEEEPTPLGGVLRAKDLKALTMASSDIEAFKRLGSGVLSPPHTASPTKATFEGTTNGTANPTEDLPLTPSEIAHLNALHIEKTDLQVKLEVLRDREKFVSMVREQAMRVAEKEKVKAKDFCGYDSRLSWSDSEFLHWRKSKAGHAAFKFNTLSPTAEQLAEMDVDGDGDTEMNGAVNGHSPDQESQMICNKKRCSKHPQWQKLNLQDARFEELEVVEAIRECEKEERAVRERARRRGAKDAMEADLVDAAGEKKEERNRDGWVEVVDAQG
jgi:COMPASS component SPP1